MIGTWSQIMQNGSRKLLFSPVAAALYEFQTSNQLHDNHAAARFAGGELGGS